MVLAKLIFDKGNVNDFERVEWIKQNLFLSIVDAKL
jgi:hypothetical protein